MPPVEYGEHLISYLSELGWIMSGGNGLTYQEIESWASLTCVKINAWEANMIKTLSDVFAGQFSKKLHDEQAPYVSRPETKKEAAKRIKSQLRG